MYVCRASEEGLGGGGSKMRDPGNEVAFLSPLLLCVKLFCRCSVVLMILSVISIMRG